MAELLKNLWDRPALRGAFSAALGVHIAGMGLFPLLELTGLVDESSSPLFEQIGVGFLGAIWVSWFAAIVGAISAAKLGQSLDMLRRIGLVAVGSFLATVPVLLFEPDPMSIAVLATLGAIATAIALSMFSFRADVLVSPPVEQWA